MTQKFQMRPRTTLFISSLALSVFFLPYFCTEVSAQEKTVTAVTTDKQEMNLQPSPKSSKSTVNADETSQNRETQQVAVSDLSLDHLHIDHYDHEFSS